MNSEEQVIGVPLDAVLTPAGRAKFYNCAAWLRVRTRALIRDHYECVWCKAQGLVTTSKNATLEIDHIKELEYHPELALTLSNLRTLCHECHNKRHNRYKEKKFNDEVFEF